MAGAAGQDLPLAGIASAGFRVSGLEKARAFYSGLLGFEEAFHLSNDKGEVRVAWFKINDEQYYEIYPGLPADENVRCTHVAFLTPDIEKLRRMLADRGLQPGPITASPEGNRVLEMMDPDGTLLKFVQYMPGSLQENARGRFISDRRVADSIAHVGLIVADENRANAFYRDKLGFQEIYRAGFPGEKITRWVSMHMPGRRAQWVEYMLHDKPLNRLMLGGTQHVDLQTESTVEAYRKIVERGAPPSTQFPKGSGLIQLFDPDGTRTEISPRAVAGPFADR